MPFDKIPKNLPDKEWRRLDQPEDIERCLSKRNLVHLHHAPETTCTIKPLKSLLGVNSLTKFGNDLLQGTANLDGLGLTSHQKMYFQEIGKQSGTLKSPLFSVISIKDMTNGFKKWRENITTSPPSRHLGHYKALLTFDDEKDKELEGFNSEMLTIYNTIINASIHLGTIFTRCKKIDSRND